jgi:hypothetical protein
MRYPVVIEFGLDFADDGGMNVHLPDLHARQWGYSSHQIRNFMAQPQRKTTRENGSEGTCVSSLSTPSP